MPTDKRRKPKRIRTTVILESIDEAIVNQVEKDYGLSRSAALRFIIRQFGRIEGEAVPAQQSC